MRTLLVIGMLELLLVAGVLPADAVVCRTRKGGIVLRDACRDKEATLDLSVVGPPGAQGPTGSDGADGAPPLRVVDAQGRVVGPAVYTAWYVTDPGDRLAGSALMYVLIDRDAVGGSAIVGVDNAGGLAGRVYWTSDGCTGDPVMPGSSFMPVVEVIGGVAFVSGTSPTPVPLKSVESANDAGGCTSVTPRGGCCNGTSGMVAARLATSTTLEALDIQLPLRAVAP